jgi:beta-lactamase class A
LSDINEARQLNAKSTLEIGRSYTVESLIERMLVYSDNGAKNLLLSHLDNKYLLQLLNLVSFTNSQTSSTYDISSRKYANFIRVLYGSTFINEEHSEFILSLLARSDFKEGIVAGLPPNVLVAHKYGVYEFPEVINGNEILTVQLHDCGIVYHASNPYTFCLMTKGKDDESLFRVLSTVSKKVYIHQDEHAKNGLHQ